MQQTFPSITVTATATSPKVIVRVRTIVVLKELMQRTWYSYV